MPKITFSYREFQFLQLIKDHFFQAITKDSVNLFLRGGDYISISPQITGTHEPALTEFIRKLSNDGYDDFFIDIGANIGLSSCQNGDTFKNIIAFEPNPLALNILKVNTTIALNNVAIEINEYGLGNKNEHLPLMIPKDNWGGAFIKGNENAYSDEILAGKDGYSKINPDNYTETQVEIREASKILKEKFQMLNDNGYVSGVIKIDVEGMEQNVLKGISASLPKNMKTIIIFENFDPNLPLNKILKGFQERKVQSYILENRLPFKSNWPRLLKAFCLILSSSKTTLVTCTPNSSLIGDIVISIN